MQNSIRLNYAYNCLLYVLLWLIPGVLPVSGKEMPLLLNHHSRELIADGSQSFEIPQMSVVPPDTSGVNLTYLGLDLEVSDISTFVSGVARYHAISMKDELNHLSLELNDGLAVDSVLANGMRCPYSHSAGLLTLHFPSFLQANNWFTFEIWYHGSTLAGGFFSGISSSKLQAWNISVTWTLSEPYGARDWFPAKQVLTDKVDSLDMNLTVPSNCLAGSNGLLSGISTLPDGRKSEHWKSWYPIDYYLISFAVADYQDYSFYTHFAGTNDSLLVQNYLYNRPDYLESVQSQVDATAKLINLYSRLFGPYPFPKEKYGHCVAPMGGGMEHQTMTTLSSFDFTLVAHELCHMWFGDLVTCADWQDIWVNEGFATYGEYLALEKLQDSSSAARWMQAAHGSALRSDQGSIFVPEGQIGDPNRIFNSSLSYKKGASMLHMLRYEIHNDSLFFEAVKNYRNQFACSTATGADFEHSVEATTGRDFSWFFNQWYYGEGYPQFNVYYDQANGQFSLLFEQTTSSPKTPMFITSLDIKLLFAGGDTLIRVWIDHSVKKFDWQISRRVLKTEIDPGNWVLKKCNLTWHELSRPFALYPNPCADHL